jgi:hypothetical protein
MRCCSPQKLRLRSSGAARKSSWLNPLAANPLRPSAERAKPNAVTSDALCRIATPAWELHLPRRTLPCQDRDSPLPYWGSEARAIQRAFARRGTRHCCQAGLTCARCSARTRSPSTLVARSEPAPRSWGAVEPCYPTRAAIALGAKAAAKERYLSPTSATDLQEKHRSNRLIPASRTPLGAVDAGGDPFDAEPPASGRLPTHPRGRTAKGERRTGAALRCVGVLGRAQRSKPNPLTPHVQSEPASPDCEGRSRRAPVKEHDAVSPRRLPSTCAPCAACASQETRHLSRGFAAFGSASDASPFFSSRLERLGPPRVPGLITLAPAGQTSHVDFCNHHGSPAQPRIDRPPRAPSRALSPCTVDAGSLCTSRCAAGQAVSGPGATGGLTPSPAPPPRLLAGKLCPGPIGSDTSCHELAPAPAGEAEHR